MNDTMTFTQPCNRCGNSVELIVTYSPDTPDRDIAAAARHYEHVLQEAGRRGYQWICDKCDSMTDKKPLENVALPRARNPNNV